MRRQRRNRRQAPPDTVRVLAFWTNDDNLVRVQFERVPSIAAACPMIEVFDGGTWHQPANTSITLWTLLLEYTGVGTLVDAPIRMTSAPPVQFLGGGAPEQTSGTVVQL